MEPEIDLIQLPAEEWREILAEAAVLDLVHGGYFRARTRMVLFYCGPENAPAGWPGEYPEGSPDLPRALVGEAEVEGFDEANDEVTVRLKVSNWGAMRSVKRAFERGEYRGRFEVYVRDQEAALRGRPEDRDWLRAQFRRLREQASGRLVGG